MIGRKVFISYKYADDGVYPLPPHNVMFEWARLQRRQGKSSFPLPLGTTKVRDYVDYLQKLLEKIGYKCKGEKTNEDLSGHTKEYIWEQLKDEIYDSSVTLVLISPRMKEFWKESSQWIHREIEYSLKRITRNDRASNPNAIVAVILPDMWGKYDYYYTMNHFELLEENIKKGYAEVVKWKDFENDPKKYIERAIEKRDDDGIKPVKTV